MLKFVDEYRRPEECLEIAARIRALSHKKMNIMEVCGGHTMAIHKYGLHKLLGENIKLISGPGCPVCVTAMEDIDAAIALSFAPKVVICAFGDLFYVPGTDSSLAQRSAERHADIRVVYSVYDALNFAKAEQDKRFIFISIGFETTAPTAAAAILRAAAEGVDNFYILGLNKTMPEALAALLGDKQAKIDALICPGHVSAITGIAMYGFIVERLGISCCVSGFEPLDLLTSIYILAALGEQGQAKLFNAYKRAVPHDGNPKAQRLISEVFEPADASWRGLGRISNSGLKLKKSYVRFEARENFDLKVSPAKETAGCLCGEILRGKKQPADCPHFGRTCTPGEPRGACMVSSEGACAAWYKYGN